MLFSIFYILSIYALISYGKKPSLATYNVDISRITTSGLSSGAAMATQFHFSHSNTIKGAGIVAGLPYLCADSFAKSLSCQYHPSRINVKKLIKKADRFDKKRKIDPTSNLKGDKVYIFNGITDAVVKQANGFKVREMYAHYGAKIRTKFKIKAGHGWPTVSVGGPCPNTNRKQYFINKCNYDGSYEVLNWLYDGELKKATNNSQILANLLDYDQTEFTRSFSGILNKDGYIYVPTACRQGTLCKLHVNFHGCLQSKDYIGSNYITRIGLNDVAEINNIIILYPSTKKESFNPEACWDWYAYTGKNYGTKDGIEIKAVYKMVKRVAGV